MRQGFIPTIEANHKGNLKNGRTYFHLFEAPSTLNSRVVGLVHHRIDRGFARSIQAVSPRNGTRLRCRKIIAIPQLTRWYYLQISPGSRDSQWQLNQASHNALWWPSSI